MAEKIAECAETARIWRRIVFVRDRTGSVCYLEGEGLALDLFIFVVSWCCATCSLSDRVGAFHASTSILFRVRFGCI